MGWTFRKSKKLGPFRLTASPRGLSLSGGVPGARASINTRGEVRRILSIPGTGIYNTKRVGTVQREKILADLARTADAAVYQIMTSQSQEQQEIIYQAYLEDPDLCLDTVTTQIVASGTLSRGRGSDAFRDALERYMERWTAQDQIAQ
jgi:hypothetical protein